VKKNFKKQKSAEKIEIPSNSRHFSSILKQKIESTKHSIHPQGVREELSTSREMILTTREAWIFFAASSISREKHSFPEATTTAGKFLMC